MTSKTDYAAILAEATEAANRAGDKWMEAALARGPAFRVVERANPLDDKSPVVRDLGGMLDVCGFAWVKITDKRSGFARWVKKAQNGYADFLLLRHKYDGRQELGLAEACAHAALEVLWARGVTGVGFTSRID
jgi:hypothetical protein